MGIGHFVGPWGVGLFFALERSRLSLGDQDQPRVPNKQFSYRILWTSLWFSAWNKCANFKYVYSLIVKILTEPNTIKHEKQQLKSSSAQLAQKQQEYKIHLSVYSMYNVSTLYMGYMYHFERNLKV